MTLGGTQSIDKIINVLAKCVANQRQKKKHKQTINALFHDQLKI